MSYYLRKIEKIITVLEEQQYPLLYEPQKWTFPTSIFSNCYAYALNLPVTDPRKEIFIPGRISKPDSTPLVFCCLDLMRKLQRDLDFLGISFKDDDGNTLKDNEYRIYIYTSHTSHHCWPVGFHFIRQDSDGFWSHKKSWIGNIERFEKLSDISAILKMNNFSLVSKLVLSRK